MENMRPSDLPSQGLFSSQDASGGIDLGQIKIYEYQAGGVHLIQAAWCVKDAVQSTSHLEYFGCRFLHF